MTNKYESLEVEDYTGFDGFLCRFVEAIERNNWEQYYYVAAYGSRDFIYDMLIGFMRPYYANRFEIGSIDFAGRDVGGATYNGEYCLYVNSSGVITVDFARNEQSAPYSIGSEVSFIYQEDCEQDIIDEALYDESNRVVLFGCDADAETVQGQSDDGRLHFYRKLYDISQKLNDILDELEVLKQRSWRSAQTSGNTDRW